MDEATQVEFIATVCKGFADAINDSRASAALGRALAAG
jgi:hypothetical protein